MSTPREDLYELLALLAELDRLLHPLDDGGGEFTLDPVFPPMLPATRDAGRDWETRSGGDAVPTRRALPVARPAPPVPRGSDARVAAVPAPARGSAPPPRPSPPEAERIAAPPARTTPMEPGPLALRLAAPPPPPGSDTRARPAPAAARVEPRASAPAAAPSPDQPASSQLVNPPSVDGARRRPSPPPPPPAAAAVPGRPGALWADSTATPRKDMIVASRAERVSRHRAESAVVPQRLPTGARASGSRRPGESRGQRSLGVRPAPLAPSLPPLLPVGPPPRAGHPGARAPEQQEEAPDVAPSHRAVAQARAPVLPTFEDGFDDSPVLLEEGGVGLRHRWSLPREEARAVERRLLERLQDRAARRWR